MERPLRPAYVEFADVYNEKSPFVTQAFQVTIKENNFEKLHIARKRGDEFFNKWESPDIIRYQKQNPGPNDFTVNLTIFRPPGTEDEVLPTIIHAHGRRFVLETVQTYAKASIDICLGAHAVVVFVEYSLSPQVKYPVANEEVYMPAEVNDLPKHYAKPLTATTEQLQDLPPALVLTCQCEVLHDEGEAYATKLLNAGVNVVGIRILGTTHGFMSRYPPGTSVYKRALNNVVDFIKENQNY